MPPPMRLLAAACLLAAGASPFSTPPASSSSPRTLGAASALHASGGPGSARGGAALAKEQEKRRIELVAQRRQEKECGGGGADDEECSLIDDAMDEELKKLNDLEPLERQLVRLEGLEPYVLVSVLTATASFSTIANKDVIVDGATDWTAAGLVLASLGSTLCGIYSTIIFALTILYGKTALGMDKEEAYFAFLDRTSAKRMRGFQTFALSLLLFCVSIFLLTADKLPEQYRPIAFALSCGFIFFGFSEWRDVTGAAEPIFADVKQRQENRVPQIFADLTQREKNGKEEFEDDSVGSQNGSPPL